MYNLRPFAPAPADSKTISATTSSAATSFNPAGQFITARLYNAGPDTVFVEFGGSAVVAAVASGMPIPPGQTEVFAIHPIQYIATICPTSTATLYVTPGEGV